MQGQIQMEASSSSHWLPHNGWMGNTLYLDGSARALEFLIVLAWLKPTVRTVLWMTLKFSEWMYLTKMSNILCLLFVQPFYYIKLSEFSLNMFSVLLVTPSTIPWPEGGVFLLTIWVWVHYRETVFLMCTFLYIMLNDTQKGEELFGNLQECNWRWQLWFQHTHTALVAHRSVKMSLKCFLWNKIRENKLSCNFSHQIWR